MDKKPDDRNIAKNPGNETVNHDELADYLDGNSPISREWQNIQKLEPSAELDQSILKESREATADDKKDESGRSGNLWIKPLSAVAVMGICAAVVLGVMNYGPADLAEIESASPSLVNNGSDELASQAEYDTEAASEELDEAAIAAARKQVMARAKMDENASGQADTDAARARIQEMLEPAAKQESPLTEAPASIALDDEIFVEEKNEAIGETTVAADERTVETGALMSDNALEAWEQGAQPSAGVWLVGTEVTFGMTDTAASVRELDKMALVYPAAVAKFRQPDDNAIVADTVESSSTKTGVDNEQNLTTTAASDPRDLLTDPDVWAAGIRWLYDQGDMSAAEQELDKFRQIYPEHEL